MVAKCHEKYGHAKFRMTIPSHDSYQLSFLYFLFLGHNYFLIDLFGNSLFATLLLQVHRCRCRHHRDQQLPRLCPEDDGKSGLFPGSGRVRPPCTPSYLSFPPEYRQSFQKSVDIARESIAVSGRPVALVGAVGPYATYLRDASEYTGAYVKKPDFREQVGVPH